MPVTELFIASVATCFSNDERRTEKISLSEHTMPFCRVFEKQSSLRERKRESSEIDRGGPKDAPFMASRPLEVSAGPGEGCLKSTLVATSL